MRPCRPTIRTALCLSALAFSANLVAEEPTRFAADRPVDCLHIKLDLNVDVEGRHVDATATIDLTALRPVTTISLDANELEIHRVKLARDGAAPRGVRNLNDGSTLDVLLEKPLAVGEKATLVIDYSVDNPSTGLHFFGPSENEPDVPYVVWSQGESTFNSYWFPCFDHPNERQTTELVVTTSSNYAVSSNGRLLSKDESQRAGTVTYHWLQAQPHVAYLVSMIVGEFSITRETWRGKSIEYWVHPRYQERVERSFRNTIRMLDFFSDSIGVEYPWDRYAQICCEGFGGGMENTSATTLGNRTLHDARSFRDSDSDGLIAHELAHQWWGDLLTCRDWAHLWLNEGFASYFEALWDEYDLGPDEFAYNMYRKAASARRGGRDRPIVDRAYSHSRAMFDSRAYPKGAWVLHMVRRRLGDEFFWQVLNAYGTGHAYQTVETVDLRKTIEKVTGQSFERFFYDWTDRPGHPEVNVSYKWLSDDKLAKVSIKQTQKAAAFHFPLTIEFRFDGKQLPLRFDREITEKEITFYYPLPEAPSMVRVDPEQSVLMELEQRMGRDLWTAQLIEDPSAVSRIRAAAHFGESKSDADRKLLASALESERFWGVQREIARALAESGGDIARDALIAGLKFPDHKARRACVEQLDSFKGDEAVLDAVRPLVVDGDPSYSVEAAAIETYAALEPADGYRVLEPVLGRDSRGEIIRSAALSGLGRMSEPQVIPLLCEWTRPDKPRRARPAAIRAVARVSRNVYLDEQATEPIVEALTAALNDSGYRVRWSAASALGSLSDPARARSALGTLRAIAANDPRNRVRRTAERTIEAIEKGEPAQVQLDELRDELKAAVERNEELADRLDRLESREPAAETEAAESAPAP